MPYIIT